MKNKLKVGSRYKIVEAGANDFADKVNAELIGLKFLVEKISNHVAILEFYDVDSANLPPKFHQNLWFDKAKFKVRKLPDRKLKVGEYEEI